MKRHCLFLSILVVAAALGAAPAPAALVSLYTFDCTGDNAVEGAPSGTFDGPNGTYYGPQFSVTDGPIRGGKALKFDGTDDSMNLTTEGFPKTSAYGAPSNGLWIGSASFWMKTGDNRGQHVILGGARLGDNTTFEIVLHEGRLRLHVESARSTGPSGLFQVQQEPQAAACCDNNWHHVVFTWNLTTGLAGTGSASLYVDGTSQDITKFNDGITSADTFSSWNWPVRIGALGRDAIYEQLCFKGVLDDMGIWNERLSDAKARALHNLAKDGVLGFGVQDAQDLFETFDEGPGARSVVGGRTWQYATGLSGAAGQVVGNHGAVILDNRGNGVQVAPEPKNDKQTPTFPGELQ
jgi:hypothetical protein